MLLEREHRMHLLSARLMSLVWLFSSHRLVQVMYIPNHCSYFDIMTMSGFLPRPIKYISKADILKIPFIGWAMKMAHHITITRTDRRSQVSQTVMLNQV